LKQGKINVNIFALKNTVIKNNFGKITCNINYFASEAIGCELALLD
jgi:hypothetical protein